MLQQIEFMLTLAFKVSFSVYLKGYFMNSITVFFDSGQVRPSRTKTKTIVNVYLTNFTKTSFGFHHAWELMK